MTGLRFPLSLLAVIALTAASACASRSSDELAPGHAAKLDSGARLAMTEAPDSIIGVLLWTSAEPGDGERAELAEAGLEVGAVVEDVVSGRIRAGDLPRLARLPFVVYIERAREAELHRPPGTRGANAWRPGSVGRPRGSTDNED